MKFITSLALIFLSAPSFAANNAPRVVAMIQANTIGAAAIAQAKQYAGVNVCTFNTQAQEVQGSDPGTVDYTVHVTCTATAPSDQGILNVATLDFSGRMFSGDGPQNFTLVTSFGSGN